MRNGLPITEWLPKYRRSWLRGDLIAGATIWAVLVPLALAYAEILTSTRSWASRAWRLCCSSGGVPRDCRVLSSCFWVQ